MASPTTAGSPAITMRLPTTTHRTICPCLLNGGVPDRFQSTSPARHIINWQCEGASGSSSYSSRRDKPYNVSSKTTLAFSSYSRYWRWHAILSRCQIREEHISNGEEIGGDDKKNDPSDRRPPAQRLVGAIITLFATAKEWLHSQLTVVSSYWLRNWRKMLLAFGFGCVLGIFCICNQLAANKAPKMLPYSQLVESLEMGIVKNVLFEEGSHNIFFNVMPESQEVESDHHDEKLESGNGLESEAGKLSARAQEKLKKVFRGSPAPWKYSTRRIQNDEPYLLELIRSNKVEYSSAPRSLSATLGSALVTIITLWIPLSPLLWFMHKQLSTGSDSSKKRPNTVQLVKFHDVAGVDAAKAELVEIVSCLKGTSNFRSLGARLPKGVLLIGPPGTGKTLLARALAGEAGVPFFAASASEFVEMFVGRGAARIRDLFGKARKCSPSIIFIDELDAVGGRRGRSLNDERDQTLNQLLTEMDGFESESGVLVLAATNRPEALDPALCRPGRFSRRVYVKEPEWEGRCQVLAVHMRNIVTQEDQGTICKAIASITPGFVGADLANLVNEAALLAARRGQSAVTIEDFKEAVMRAKYGAGQTTNFRRSMEKKLCKLVAWAVPGSGQDLMDDSEADGLQMATNG